MTVRKPIIHIVGDGPIEKIIRSIIDATNVRMPAGRGTVNILTSESNITVHINPDKWEFNSKVKTKVRLCFWCDRIFSRMKISHLLHYFQMDKSMR